MLDLAVLETRQRIAQHTKREREAAGMDGFMVDLLRRSPFASRADDVLMPASLFQAWPSHLLASPAELRASQPNATIWINAPMREDGFAEAALRYVDGIVIEDPSGPRATSWHAVRDIGDGVPVSRASRWSELTALTGRLGKQLIMAVNTNINCRTPASPGCFGETTVAEQQRDARYYLAAFLNVMGTPRTYLALYTPTPDSPQFHSAAFFEEWDLPIGSPTGASVEVASSVFARRFEHALAVWNNADAPYAVDLADRPMVTLDAALVRHFVMPAKTGMLFVAPVLIRSEEGPRFRPEKGPRLAW